MFLQHTNSRNNISYYGILKKRIGNTQNIIFYMKKTISIITDKNYYERINKAQNEQKWNEK